MEDFISLKHDSGHFSSLEIHPDHLKVVGVLYHGTEIQPRSVEDATAMIKWLSDWVNKTHNSTVDKVTGIN